MRKCKNVRAYTIMTMIPLAKLPCDSPLPVTIDRNQLMIPNDHTTGQVGPSVYLPNNQ